MESNRGAEGAEEEMNMRYVRCVDHGTRFMDLDNLVVEMCDKCRVVEGEERDLTGRLKKTIYRLSWETVDTNRLFKYFDADPMVYSNVTQIVPNSKIPDGEWYAVSVETSDPWAQYRQLKEWSEADIEFIRNVKLEEQISEPVWKVVIDTGMVPESPQERLG